MNPPVMEEDTRSSINHGRHLQQDRVAIGGVGVATVKVGRRRYRRNFRTGEEQWDIVVGPTSHSVQPVRKVCVLHCPFCNSGSNLIGYHVGDRVHFM
jgi:hypothetical protein